MTTPADFPLSVAPGELIVSTWGNQVAAALSMKRAWATLARANVPLGTGGGDVLIQLTGLTGIVDPLAMITTAGLQVPAAWAGLWDVRWTVNTTGATIPTTDLRVESFVQIGSVKTNNRATSLRLSSANDVNAAAADLVVVPPAGGLIQLYANCSFTGDVSGVDFALTAAYFGPGLP